MIPVEERLAALSAMPPLSSGSHASIADGIPAAAPDLSDAACFCSVGALWRVLGDCRSSPAETILGEIVRTTTRFDNPVSFNDDPSTTHADVLRVFDLAVAAAAKDVV